LDFGLQAHTCKLVLVPDERRHGRPITVHTTRKPHAGTPHPATVASPTHQPVQHAFNAEPASGFRAPKKRKFEEHRRGLPSCDALVANNATRILSIPSPEPDPDHQDATYRTPYTAKCSPSRAKSDGSAMAESAAQAYTISGKRRGGNRQRQDREASQSQMLRESSKQTDMLNRVLGEVKGIGLHTQIRQMDTVDF
jgi:hypothetical protein